MRQAAWMWRVPRRSDRRLRFCFAGRAAREKGVLARAIHARSIAAAAPFITVNCPSLSAELLESDLFGHTRGRLYRGGAGYSWKGRGGRRWHAVPRRDWRPAAGPATQTPAALAGKALRTRGGDAHPCVRRADPAATNHDLQAAVAAGTFREDLFYRLNVIDVELPAPLRQRATIFSPRLAEHLLQFFAHQSGRPPGNFTEEARAALPALSLAGKRP